MLNNLKKSFSLLVGLLAFSVLVVSQHTPREKPATSEQPPANNKCESERTGFMQCLETTKAQDKSLYETKAEKEKQETDRWVMRFTGLMAIFTLFLVCVTGYLAYYTYQLWSATHKLVGDAEKTSERQAAEMQNSLRIAEKAADAAKIAADATTKSADAVVAAERAYIFVEVILEEQNIQSTSSGFPNRIRIKFWNYGKTPAEVTTIRRMARVQRENPTRAEDSPWEGSGLPLPPGLGIATNCSHDVFVTGSVNNQNSEQFNAAARTCSVLAALNIETFSVIHAKPDFVGSFATICSRACSIFPARAH